MGRSHEKNREFSVLCILITNIEQNIAIFYTKLEKSPSDLQFFLPSFGQIFGIVATQLAQFFLKSQLKLNENGPIELIY